LEKNRIASSELRMAIAAPFPPMKTSLSRRQFFAVASAATACSLLAPQSARAAEFKSKIRKAKIIGKVTEAALAPLKAAGFQGVETTHICPEEEAAQGRALAEQMGMRVHSVLRGWMSFNSDDPKAVKASQEQVRLALRAAKGYGADAILVVPCKVGGIAMPEPWEFDIEFDEKNGHVSRVVKGDNSKFEGYIAAQNKATDTSRKAVEALIPLAGELKVIIALENVWNNLWVKPELYRHFIASFAHPWVKAYFDIGNHVKYSPPQNWIKVLGPLIAKLHVKDFKLNPDGHGGEFVHPRDGSIDWPAVLRALDAAGYDGWATIEDDGLPPEEFNARLDLIIAGK
jgi:L-ribulose-5-phosphate 3-epimerase